MLVQISHRQKMSDALVLNNLSNLLLLQILLVYLLHQATYIV